METVAYKFSYDCSKMLRPCWPMADATVNQKKMSFLIDFTLPQPGGLVTHPEH